MVRIMHMLMLTITVRLTTPKRDEHGAGAVEWLMVLGAGIAIAIFAGDSVMTFAKGLVGGLGGK